MGRGGPTSHRVGFGAQPRLKMILAITPARGGSKGIPRKNIRPLCGRPLIAWTIDAAQRATLIDRFVVSTEDAEIAEVARAAGAEVLPRPAELAGDEVTTVQVLRQVLEEIPADTVVLLQATSPVRDADLIDRCIRRYRETGADSLATGLICTWKEYGTALKPRQQLDGFFYDDGNVYVMDAEGVRARADRFGVRREQMVLDREQNVEIDDEFDFWLAEQVLSRRLATGR